MFDMIANFYDEKHLYKFPNGMNYPMNDLGSMRLCESQSDLNASYV